MPLMVVRQEPSPYGKGNALEPDKSLGNHEFDAVPQPGSHIDVRGETWVVTRLVEEAVYVTPIGEVHGED